jgi:hypothetical protein
LCFVRQFQANTHNATTLNSFNAKDQTVVFYYFTWFEDVTRGGH